jgi:hypothetical protein
MSIIKDSAATGSATSNPNFSQVYTLLCEHRDCEASMVAKAGETNRDSAWTPLAQILGFYNIIELKYYI